MKIALYCRTWTSHGLGGMQVAAKQAALGLAKRGHEVHVFTTALEKYSGEIIDGDVLIHHLDCPIKKYSTEYFDAAFKLFQSIGGFDVVYSHSTAGRRHLDSSVPILAHWHGIGGMEDVKNLAKIGCTVPPKKFDAEILKYPRHIAIAPHEARYIIKSGMDASRVHIVHYGTNDYREDLELRNVNRKALGLKPSDFVVGIAGRLVTDKGVRQVASALPSLDSHIRILLVGDGDAVGAFKQRTVHQKTVEMDQMCGYYNAMDLLVDPTTRNQGFDLIPIEAAFCGTPLLLSNVGSFKEVFIEGARFFELGNIQQLAQQINELSNSDQIAILRAKIKNLASQLFTQEKMLKGIEEALYAAIRDIN